MRPTQPHRTLGGPGRKGLMFVSDRGSGPAVVFLPGLGCDHTLYDPQVEALQGRYRCLAVDLRGCGASPSLAGVPVEQVLTVQAAEVIEALDARGIASAHLVGISYGGVLAQRLMLSHPDRVATAVICDSFCDTRPRTLTEAALL